MGTYGPRFIVTAYIHGRAYRTTVRGHNRAHARQCGLRRLRHEHGFSLALLTSEKVDVRRKDTSGAPMPPLLESQET